MNCPNNLTYHIQFQEKKGLFLEILLNNQKRKALYLDTLKKTCTSNEEKIVKDLIRLHRKNHPFESLDCLSFNRIEIPLKSSLSLFKELAALKTIFLKNIPLSYYPIAPEMFFEIEEKNDQTALVMSSFRLNGKKLYPEKIFLDAGYIIENSVVYPIEAGLLWVESYLEKRVLSKEKKESLLFELDEEEIPIELKRAEALMKTPVLYLKDPRALFSKIGVEYQGMGTFIVGERSQNGEIVRDFLFEENLKKDLKELLWAEKAEGYYLPLDLVYENLRFLLEMGWRVFDYQKREVLISKKINLNFSLKEEIELEATVEEDKLDLMTLSRSCLDNNLFSPLSENSVSLLDPELKQKMRELLSRSTFRDKKLILKKEQFGHLLDDKPYITKDLALRDFSSGREIAIEPQGFLGKLFPYQEKGVSFLSFLYKNGFGGLLADEMGLGKTVQVLAFLASLEKGPHLICVPASLIFNWKNEIAKFLEKIKVVIHHGPKRIKDKTLLLEGDIILTSYQTLRQDSDFFREIDFCSTILDEAMVIKNPKSKVFQAVSLLKSSFKLCITATPIENRIEELISLFSFVMPDLAKTWEKEPLAVNQEIKPFLLRRLKKEVDIELPEKVEQDVWVDLTDVQKKSIERVLSEKKGHLAEKNSMEILTLILRLRQISCHPHLVDETISRDIEHSAKLQVLFNDLEEIFLGNHKVIVYSQFTSLLKIVEEEVKKRGFSYFYLDGSTSLREREKRVTYFQETEKNSLFLISLKAGGVGLNLTGADYVYLLDPFWNDKVEAQAIDRAHRIGQKRNVIAKRLYALGTIEEKIALLKREKSSLFETVIEGQESSSLRKEVLLRLFD